MFCWSCADKRGHNLEAAGHFFISETSWDSKKCPYLMVWEWEKDFLQLVYLETLIRETKHLFLDCHFNYCVRYHPFQLQEELPDYFPPDWDFFPPICISWWLCMLPRRSAGLSHPRCDPGVKTCDGSCRSTQAQARGAQRTPADRVLITPRAIITMETKHSYTKHFKECSSYLSLRLTTRSPFPFRVWFHNLMSLCQNTLLSCLIWNVTIGDEQSTWETIKLTAWVQLSEGVSLWLKTSCCFLNSLVFLMFFSLSHTKKESEK